MRYPLSGRNRSCLSLVRCVHQGEIEGIRTPVAQIESLESCPVDDDPKEALVGFEPTWSGVAIRLLAVRINA